MPRWSLPCSLALLVTVIMTSACRRELRKGERQRAEARARLEEQARADQRARAAALAALPEIPLEPPLERTRVPDSGLPCDVDDVFARKCRRCHTTPARHAAPLVIDTWDDTRKERSGQPLYVVIGRAVASGYMPYNVQANPPVERLSDDEKKIIADWVAKGGPREECEPNSKARAKQSNATGRVVPQK